MSQALASEHERAASPHEGGQIEALDLTDYGVLQHFVRATRNPKILHYLKTLDSLDRWAVDYPATNDDDAFQVQLFLQELQKVIESSMSVLHRVPEDLAEILSRLTTARCLLVLRYVGQRNGDFAEQMGLLLGSDEAGETPSLSVIRKRLDALSKAQLLAEIFSGKRLTHILKIMGSYADV